MKSKDTTIAEQVAGDIQAQLVIEEEQQAALQAEYAALIAMYQPPENSQPPHPGDRVVYWMASEDMPGGGCGPSRHISSAPTIPTHCYR